MGECVSADGDAAGGFTPEEADAAVDAVPGGDVLSTDKDVTGGVVPVDDDAVSDVAPALTEEIAAGDVVPSRELALADDDAASEVAPVNEIATGNVDPASENVEKDVTTADVGADEDNVSDTVSAARLVVASAGPDGSED